VSRETGGKIAGLEHTDVIEVLVSGDDGKMKTGKQRSTNHHAIASEKVRHTLPKAD
jgi:hypothetical protein